MSFVSRSPGVHSAWLGTRSHAKALVDRACVKNIATACIVYLLISTTFPQLCLRGISQLVFLVVLPF